MFSDPSVEEIDYKTGTIASRALCVIFIILIVSLNGILILKTVRKPKFFLSPKCMLIISLAIGDIFLALFSIVVDAKGYFAESDVNCVTLLTSLIYNTFVINFAYGVGVIILALELVFRYKEKNMVAVNRQAPVAFTFSLVPWFLVLIFVLPLTMAGTDWKTCFRPTALFPASRNYAMFWMCDIVPPVLAFIASLVIMFIKLTPRQESSNPGTTGVDLEDYNSGPGTANQTQNFPVQQQHLNATATTTNGKVAYQGIPKDISYNMQNYPPQQPQIVVSITLPQFPNNSTTQPQFPNNPTREKTLLLVVAIANLVCVIPFGAFCVTDWSLLTFHSFIVIFMSLSWILRFRSILTPIIWFFDN